MFLLSLGIAGVVWFAFAGHLALDRERIIAGKFKENDNLALSFAEHVTRMIRAAEEHAVEATLSSHS